MNSFPSKSVNSGSQKVEVDFEDAESKPLRTVAILLSLLSISIMVLSIVANDNFGDDLKESFKL